MFIKRAVWEEMIHHCKEELPMEACGLLSGNNRKCETLWKMKNVKQNTHSFEISQKEIDKAFHSIEKKGQTLTGIYHSHPTGAPYPSHQDIVNAHYPKAAYFIISLVPNIPQVKCFRIIKNRVISIEIKVVN
ncbi:M67 family metallopeptidase [Alteribacillus bidgolensis]|nr:M67 family metallopeptidase [Alteribacillus bidgolensis]